MSSSLRDKDLMELSESLHRHPSLDANFLSVIELNWISLRRQLLYVIQVNTKLALSVYFSNN